MSSDVTPGSPHPPFSGPLARSVPLLLTELSRPDFMVASRIKLVLLRLMDSQQSYYRPLDMSCSLWPLRRAHRA